MTETEARRATDGGKGAEARRETVRLEPLTALSLKDQVTRQLTDLIENGSFAPGQQMPSERELAEQLRVSRGTVREAVQFLHALGLVEIRHGSGTFVRASPADGDNLRSQWRTWTAGHAERVHELLEVRRGLESFAAELAAQRMDEPGHARLEAAIGRMEEAIERSDITELIETDVAFHRELAAASGNSALTELVESLGEQLVQERGTVWDRPGRPELSLREHRAIFEAVRARDGERARASLLEHLASVERDLDAVLSDLPVEEGR